MVRSVASPAHPPTSTYTPSPSLCGRPSVDQTKIGDTVKVHLTGRLDHGSPFETSMHRDRLESILGDGELIPGFEEAGLGMNPGDTKMVAIPAEQAYAAHRLEIVMEVDRQYLLPTLQPYVGQRLQMTQQDGTSVPVLVMVVTDAQVTLDANHPLTGKDLIPPAFQATPTAVPHPAAPVQHQPKLRCTMLRVAPGRSGGRPRGRGKRCGRQWPLAGARPKRAFGFPICWVASVRV
jgi:peptidylprolyl isomerase